MNSPTLTRAEARPVGVLGGTFDPVHVGHLALARSAMVALQLGSVRFIPTGRSWQKDAAGATAAQRIDMLRLAVATEPHWIVDERETRRSGPSYTVDTLADLRAELGADVPLVMLLGSDQLHNLATWHRYDELLSLAHIAATVRGARPLQDFEPRVEALLQAHGRDALPQTAAGSIVFFRMPPVPVSSTALRQALARGDRPAELLPPRVLDYIEQHHLYQRAAQES